MIKSKIMVKRLVIFALVIIVIGVSFFTGKLIQNKYLLDKKYNLLKDDTRVKLDNLLRLLYDRNDWNESISTIDFNHNDYLIFVTKLDELTMLFEISTDCFNTYQSQADYHFFDELSKTFRFITTAIKEGASTNKYKVVGFSEDGVISKNELKFLTNLFDDLKMIRINLYGGDDRLGDDITKNHQIDNKLKLKDFINSFSPFMDKYSYKNIYKEAGYQN
jgi:hypothetical protein